MKKWFSKLSKRIRSSQTEEAEQIKPLDILYPFNILLILLGANSIWGYETLLTFNVASQTVEIPLPNFGTGVGICLLLLPMEPLLVKVFMKLYNMRTVKLPTGMEDSE